MSYSAFGVDHGGEISKGLPSALRSGYRAGSGTQAIRQNNRIAAHKYGREAARNLSGQKNPKAALQNPQWGSSAQTASHRIQSGKTQKGFFRQGLSGPGGRRLNKPNGFGLE